MRNKSSDKISLTGNDCLPCRAIPLMTDTREAGLTAQ